MQFPILRCFVRLTSSKVKTKNKFGVNENVNTRVIALFFPQPEREQGKDFWAIFQYCQNCNLLNQFDLMPEHYIVSRNCVVYLRYSKDNLVLQSTVAWPASIFSSQSISSCRPICLTFF